MRDEITVDELKAERNRAAEAERELETLRRTLELMKDDRHYVIPYGRGNCIRFGLFSDPHEGSLYERMDALATFYDLLHRERVPIALCAGDVLDGVGMYKGQEFEQYAIGLDRQLESARKNTPRVKGIATYFITGNHDYSYYKMVGVDPGPEIEKATGWKCIGRDFKSIDLKSDSGKALTVSLIHPAGGTAYALSYKSQKIITEIPGGKKPDIACIGHYHKAEWIPEYRNVSVFQAGCFQSQTPYMARIPTPAHVGGWIVEATLGDRKHLVSRVKGEFVSFYEPEERK